MAAGLNEWFRAVEMRGMGTFHTRAAVLLQLVAAVLKQHNRLQPIKPGAVKKTYSGTTPMKHFNESNLCHDLLINNYITPTN